MPRTRGRVAIVAAVVAMAGPLLAVPAVADAANQNHRHDDGRVVSGNFNQLLKLKKAHPGLKVEISLGGWTKSTWFADVASTAQRRQDFVKSCVDTFVNGNIPGLAPGAAKGVFDGIDIDWEYPTQAA